jgi:hypothetical protein
MSHLVPPHWERPFVEVILLPMPSPTVDQIRFFHHKRHWEWNYLTIRQKLIGGGMWMGEGLPSDVEPMIEQLRALGFRFDVRQSNTWFDPETGTRRIGGPDDVKSHA